MIRLGKSHLLALLMIPLLAALTSLQASSGRIYGKLLTVDDDEFEGWIRWDKNEAFWDDVIDGVVDKDRFDANGREARHYKERKTRSIDIFGLGGGDSRSIWFGSDNSSSSQLQFGHIQTMFCEGDNEARMLLKGGQEVEFESGADIGTSVREILLSDIDEGDIYFDWNDIEKIEFMEESRDPSDGLQRLYGRVSTRRAGEFTGWVEWDVDEVFSGDHLDGDEDRDRKRKIPFDRITAIERRSSSSASVTLTDGKEITMRNSNDVNSENRGIVVKSPEYGKIKVDWKNFEKVEFMEPPTKDLPRYDEFDGGSKIHGEVETEFGEKFEGDIAWDNDEQWSWEHLNGEYKDVEMDIPFSAIMSVEKSSQRSALVTLKNGDQYLLSGSNDVDEDNKGIFILHDGKVVEQVDWYDFRKLLIKN
jgi:hypothetical protein